MFKRLLSEFTPSAEGRGKEGHGAETSLSMITKLKSIHCILPPHLLVIVL